MNTAVGSDPNAYVFANEKGRPVWRDTLMYDHIRPKLKPHGLEWVDFQVMRATHASIGHRLRLDPKVTADQRGRRRDRGVHENVAERPGGGGKKTRTGGARKTEGSEDASSEGVLMECNGVQFFRVSVTC